MTVVDGVGTGPQTKIKLEHFQAIARMWSQVAWNVFQLPSVKRFDPRALYIDATAGPGLRNGRSSCCIHFLDAMRWYRLPYRAVLVEKDAGVYSELSDAIRRYPDTTALWGDYQTILEDTGRFPAALWQFGMLYVDPNGPSELHFDAITRFCNLLSKFPVRMAEFTYPPNVWLGTTVDKQWAVERAEKAFRKIKASGFDGVCWLSCEPMLERLTFTGLEMFDWVVMGGSSRSTQTPEYRPPFDDIVHLYEQARAAGCRVYQKTNLIPGMSDDQRIREYPIDAS